jgi:O-antigen/teichoic acid export membrane protein
MDKRQLVSNSFFLLVNRLTQSIATFVLTSAISRSLGVDQLGKYLLAFSYYFVFVSIAAFGFKTLITRELARKPEAATLYLLNGSLLQFLLALAAYIALILIVTLLPYDTKTLTTCYILGLAIFPFSLSNITEAVFQAQERMFLIAYSTVPIYILRLLLMIATMRMGYGIELVAGIFVVSELLILILQWLLLASNLQVRGVITLSSIWQLLKESRTFSVIESVSIFNTRLEIFILSLLGSELLVGFYGGIMQLMQPFQIIANSIALASFPKMSKALESDGEQRQFIQRTIEILLLIAGPLLVGILFTGGDLLTFVYGDPRFRLATNALYLTAISLIPWSFSRIVCYVLMANGLERINMREIIVDTVLKGLLGVFLVSRYHLMGAALTFVLVNLSAFSQEMYGVYRHLFRLQIWQVSRRPLVISLLMIPVFLILKQISPNFISTLIISTLAYLILIAVFGIYVFGIPQDLLKKVLHKL